MSGATRLADGDLGPFEGSTEGSVTPLEVALAFLRAALVPE